MVTLEIGSLPGSGVIFVLRIYFFRVPVSAYFPLGVRGLYRDYVADKVVEFRPTEKNRAVTRVGQLTGFDPVTHYSRWYPDEHSIPFRSVAGFSILKVTILFVVNFLVCVYTDSSNIYSLFFSRPYLNRTQL